MVNSLALVDRLTVPHSSSDLSQSHCVQAVQAGQAVSSDAVRNMWKRICNCLSGEKLCVSWRLSCWRLAGAVIGVSRTQECGDVGALLGGVVDGGGSGGGGVERQHEDYNDPSQLAAAQRV
ncbi:hypothetical protein MHYP_G00183130 [Metynnis hypsauchen]